MSASPARLAIGNGTIDILVDGAPQPRDVHGGRLYVGARKGREYAIRLRNPYAVRVAVVETLLTDPRIVTDDMTDVFGLVERLVEDAIVAAPEDDTGLWEFRTRLRPHTFSKVLCWLAAHRGARLDIDPKTGRLLGNFPQA